MRSGSGAMKTKTTHHGDVILLQMNLCEQINRLKDEKHQNANLRSHYQRKDKKGDPIH